MANLLDLKNPAPEPVPQPPVAEPGQFVDLMADGDDAEEVMEWEAHHPLPEHGRQRHYLLLAGVTLAGGVIAFWQHSWSTMLVILLSVGAWELYERLRRPVGVRVDGRGITVDGYRYPHAQLTSFDIHGMPDGTVELSLMTDRWHSRNLRLPLGPTDPMQLRELLLRHVPEDAHRIPALEWWLRKPRQ
jgi:hypothetical protein